MAIGKWIVDAAAKNGATLSGIASMDALKVSASHTIYRKMGDYAGVGAAKGYDVLPGNQLFNWPDSYRSVLVIGVSHPEDKPELDWWDGSGTPGNRILTTIIKCTSQQIESRLKLKTCRPHYCVEKGGLFLKDAAVLAGFGCIGKNNMLLTPSYGPRIRLRALFLSAEIRPTGPITFDPCADCRVYCRSVCPEKAMSDTAPVFKSVEFSEQLPGRDGKYSRALCNLQMEKDFAERYKENYDGQPAIKYCRRCEFVCPIEKKAERNTRLEGRQLNSLDLV